MINTIFTGAAVAIVTPMKDDGSVNFDKLAELVDYQIAHGTDAIVACGTTGESPTLNHAEHVDVIKEAIAAAAGRVPVIAGTGSNDTSYAIELSKEAENLGADALLMVTPYYNKASQEGLYRHYTAVADSVDTPIILYNVPSRTGTKIGLETYKRLGEHKNIVAAKEATGDISFIANVAFVIPAILFMGVSYKMLNRLRKNKRVTEIIKIVQIGVFAILITSSATLFRSAFLFESGGINVSALILGVIIFFTTKFKKIPKIFFMIVFSVIAGVIGV